MVATTIYQIFLHFFALLGILVSILFIRNLRFTHYKKLVRNKYRQVSKSPDGVCIATYENREPVLIEQQVYKFRETLKNNIREGEAPAEPQCSSPH